MKADAKTKHLISETIKRIKKEYMPKKIILYGSYVYGTPHRDSDIDLLIIKKTEERPIDRRVNIREIVSDLRRGYPFSPIVLTPHELAQRLERGDQFLRDYK